MAAVLKPPAADAPAVDPIVIVGTGPVGIQVAQELLRHDPWAHIVLHGNEPWEPYNRARLSALLNGEMPLAAIQNPLRLPRQHRVVQHYNCEIVAIDRDLRVVVDRLGRRTPYSRLVLAVGSRVRKPSIPGLDKVGVHTFRNLSDTQYLLARRVRSRRAVIIGGGLLGIETARGMSRNHTEVHIVEHTRQLLPGRLDREASEMLRERLYGMGIHVVLGDSVRRVRGRETVTGVSLRSGRPLECDTVIVAAGVTPNLGLALDAGLSVGYGIRVNARMQTSDPFIYAVGECAEFDGRVHGLIAPGLDQAAVAASHLLGGDARYREMASAARLKVAGITLFSAGRVGEDEAPGEVDEIRFRSRTEQSYRKLVLRRGRLVGAVAFGEWPEHHRIQDAIRQGRRIHFWQRRRFAASGKLWWNADAQRVRAWPAETVVCQCANATRGALTAAIETGCDNLGALCERTGAAGVCGGCKPLLAELLADARARAAGNRVPVLAAALALAVALAFMLVTFIPSAPGVQTPVADDLRGNRQ